MAPDTTQGVLSLLDKPPADIARELQRFSRTARALSSKRPRLIEKHPQQWVALYEGHVEIFGKTLKSVLAQVKTQGLPQEEVLVRYIDKNLKTLIL